MNKKEFETAMKNALRGDPRSRSESIANMLPFGKDQLRQVAVANRVLELRTQLNKALGVLDKLDAEIDAAGGRKTKYTVPVFVLRDWRDPDEGYTLYVGKTLEEVRAWQTGTFTDEVQCIETVETIGEDLGDEVRFYLPDWSYEWKMDWGEQRSAARYKSIFSRYLRGS